VSRRTDPRRTRQPRRLTKRSNLYRKKHRPRIALSLTPDKGLKTGDLLHLQITAEAAATDDITIPDNAFGGFETHKKSLRIEPLPNQRRRFIFAIDLIALEPGEQTLPEITLRVVTGDGIVGGVRTESRKLKIESLLANEPDAKPKAPTQPVQVMQDDFTLLYILGGILAALLIALGTLALARWWRKRVKPAPPLHRRGRRGKSPSKSSNNCSETSQG